MHNAIAEPVTGPVTRICRKCENCQAEFLFNVRSKDLRLWKQGLSIAVAFPYLNAEQREMLRIGICLTCQESTTDEQL